MKFISFFISFLKKARKRDIIICCAALCAALISVLIIVAKVKQSKKIQVAKPPAPDVSSAASSEPEPASSEEIPEKLLEIVNPSSFDFETTEPEFTFTGSCDKEKPLYLNGSEVECDENGNFSVKVNLNIGKNSFEFSHKEQTSLYTVNYRYVVIESFDPKGSRAYSSGSVITVNVTARSQCTVTAKFNGETITLKKTVNQGEDEEDSTNSQSNTFSNFSGSFTLPSGGKSDTALGKIEFSATCNSVTEKYSSGTITVKKSSIIKTSDPAVTPSGGKYIDVGSGLIATIVSKKAETFDGTTTDDMSRPTNNYLPEGTVDYCAEGVVTNGNNQYAKLRCGRRVYLTSNPGKSYAYQVVRTDIGTLPDHNEITAKSFTQTEQYTTLKLGCLWKSPFYFDILNQSYEDPKNQKYSFDAVTFSYIDITFCYATVFEGEIAIPENNPVFESAEIIKNQSDYTLRLRLKKTGGFYGWYAYYDSEGNLTFEFLNPFKMENRESLKGARIYIDVGHGGKDGGAGTFNKNDNEAIRNLVLANKIKSRLEALGATVIMNRTSNDTYISPPDRMNALRSARADFCVAVHHDSNGSSRLNGFGAYHFTPFSKTAAEFIDTRTDNTGIYSTNHKVQSHYYYVARVTNCPVVLTENGYLSNQGDYSAIKDDGKNDIKAQAITDGILDYFRSIQ